MKFSTVAVAAAAVAGVQAVAYNGTATTEVVDVFVTYCPGPTTLTVGTSTITVTAPTTLTLTGGPYTVTKPVTPITVTKCAACSTGKPTGGAGPVYNTTSIVKPTGAITPTASVFPGAANHVAPAGAFAAVLGLVAYLL